MNSFARKFALITTASILVSSSAYALTKSDAEALTQKIVATRVAEIPAYSAKLVSKAAKAEQIEVAKVAVLAVAQNHPTAVGTVISAVLRKAPEATEAIVTAALEAAPEMAKTIVSAAASATDGQEEIILAVAERIVPRQAFTLRAEVTSIKTTKARAALSAGVAKIFSGGAVTTTNNVEVTNAVVAVDAYPGRDPNRR